MSNGYLADTDLSGLLKLKAMLNSELGAERFVRILKGKVEKQDREYGQDRDRTIGF